MKTQNIKEPKYKEYTSGLGICVDSLTGNKFEMTSYKCDGKEFEYTLHFTFYDVFGLNSSDITGEPEKLNFKFYGFVPMFRSWYILQHSDQYNGKYEPFITYIEFDKTFKGVI